MESFLSEVAHSLSNKYGEELSSLTIVFPSQRARLFFCDELSKIADHPMWSPRFASMDDLMSEVATLQSADRLRLVVELYRIYSKYHTESFDRFYHWGEVLISDFDMIDKYCVDASMLFRNIYDIKEIESDVSYFTPSQLRFVREFWGALCGEGPVSEQKRRFLAIWRTLATIYEEYRNRLRELGIGYQGMIYREAADRISSTTEPLLTESRYVIAGFNALSKCEQVLLDYMSRNCRVDFYWDYDLYYTDSRALYRHEAGMFVAKNVERFASADDVSCDNFKNIESIDVVSTTTAVAQCKHIVSILRDIAGRDAEGRQRPLDKNTAVVLTDENLLMPLLYALPEELGKVNVTMGYPLRNTLAYSFVERLLELQSHAHNREGDATFYHVDIEGLLTHPYIAETAPIEIASIRRRILEERIFNAPKSMLSPTPLLDALFTAVTDSDALLDYLVEVLSRVAQCEYSGCDVRYRSEYLSLAVEQLVRLRNMVSKCGMELPLKVCYVIIRRHLQGVKIPFSGKPLEGLQIMGILETRNLDFRNVLVLSMSDSTFPGARIADSSFIPHNLRMGYDLPTSEHHEGVYAYYFYRLIQRAERVWLLYCSSSDDGCIGEPSRYIRQLEYETSIPITYTKVGVNVHTSTAPPLTVEKDERVMDRLLGFTDGRRAMSPTAFSRYVQCPMKFYFASIAGLKVENELTEEVDNMLFGNIFHKSAELFYTPLLNEANPAQSIERNIADGSVERAVDKAIAKCYYNGASKREVLLTGEIAIIRDIVLRYLRDNVLQYDIRRNDFAALALEAEVVCDFPFESDGRKFSLRFKGISDRIDSLDNGMLRVIDYKTGRPVLEFGGVDALFNGKADERMSNFINTLLYAMMLNHNTERDVLPELYYVRAMTEGQATSSLVDKSRKSSGDSYLQFKEEFEKRVEAVLSEMFDSSLPFVQCADVAACQKCDFIDICARQAE